ncbi:tetratricopeptide repeat protein [Leptospira sp. GIMC2001]|uniref:tetratricopeptide repeat protein n=1 Tax=Leptospira sp. GIMC2001 TaxID=1513297 RepID=UPI002349C7AB|nr:hypothetical protein [Leptospira sp. GIMC2001]WCL49985.1 hypothetical protein O4O04_03970 [Leptospira sp. GIMC2001]
MKFFLLSLVMIISMGHLSAGEDDQRNDETALYLYPNEAIKKEEMNLLDSDSRLKLDSDTGIAAPWNPEEPGDGEGPKDLDTKIAEADGLLKRYYSQFLGEKRIWEDKSRGSKYSTKNEQNEVRLLIDELNHIDSESFLIRDSEIIYKLHRRLAGLYEERENFTQSIRHYRASLRYRNFTNTEEAFLNEKKWNEILDDGSVESRNKHKLAKLSYEQAKLDYEDNKKEIHRLGSDFSQGKMNFARYQEAKKTSELNLGKRKENLDQAEKNYQDSMIENFEPARKTQSREDATTYYNLANLIRKVEEKNKERFKIINKASFVGKGIFVLFDYKRNTDFYAYEYLLEKSHRLDPSYPEPIREVANQFKIDGKKIKAIDYYNKYVDLVRKENPNLDEDMNEEIADVYLNIAILNSDIKRKVIASQYYDLFLNTTKDQEKKNRMYYELGRFNEKVIGNLIKSNEYYQMWLNTNPSEPDREAIAYYGISLRNRQDKREDKEEASLIQALNRARNLREELNTINKEIIDIEREMNQFKRTLVITTEDESLARFRILQIQLEDKNIEKDKLVAKYKSIPYSRIVLRLAEIAELQKRYDQAKEYYRDVIDIGTESEVGFSLRSIKRVEKTQSDGIMREKEKLY